jgi:isopenicillin-N epimerase
MTIARREFLTRTGSALAAGVISSAGDSTGALAQSIPAPSPAPGAFDDWAAVRAEFALSDDFIHMSAMLISSHPKTVREAIEEHRRGMDANPVTYLHENNRHLQEVA